MLTQDVPLHGVVDAFVVEHKFAIVEAGICIPPIAFSERGHWHEAPFEAGTPFRIAGKQRGEEFHELRDLPIGNTHPQGYDEIDIACQRIEISARQRAVQIDAHETAAEDAHDFCSQLCQQRIQSYHIGTHPQRL